MWIFFFHASDPLPVRDVSSSAPPVLTPPPPVMTAPETHQEPGTLAEMVHDILRKEDTEAKPDTVSGPESPVSEITSGGDDRITRDYMDYGQFERGPSPADEAVKKVKQKLIRQCAEQKIRPARCLTGSTDSSRIAFTNVMPSVQNTPEDLTFSNQPFPARPCGPGQRYKRMDSTGFEPVAFTLQT